MPRIYKYYFYARFYQVHGQNFVKIELNSINIYLIHYTTFIFAEISVRFRVLESGSDGRDVIFDVPRLSKSDERLISSGNSGMFSNSGPFVILFSARTTSECSNDILTLLWRRLASFMPAVDLSFAQLYFLSLSYLFIGFFDEIFVGNLKFH